MTSKKPIKFIVNPAAGRGNALRILPQLQEQLTSHRIEFDIEQTHSAMDAAEMARRSAESGWEVIVAVGGDGTVNEVVNGIMDTDVTLGIIPCGTGNDFSRSLHVPKDIAVAVDILQKGAVKKIDVGQTDNRYFINGIGIGFDAAVNNETRQIKGLRGTALYAAGLLKALRKYNAIEMELRFNGVAAVRDTYLIAAGNGMSVGGGFLLTPDAQLDDALFDICHVDNIKPMTIARHFSKLFNGKIGMVKEVTLDQSPHLSVASSAGMPIHIDGEVIATDAKQIDIKIVPGAVSVIGNWNEQTEPVKSG